jgi:ribonuclease HI
MGVEFSAEKTVVMLFTTKRPTSYQMPAGLKLSSQSIPFSKTAKYLGVTLDDKLSWKPHIENKIEKANRSLMAVRSVIGRTWGPSPACARWSWTSVARPALIYGSIVWSRVASQKWLITKLKRLQRLALSQVAHVRPRTLSAALEVMYGVPPLDLHIKNCAQNAAIRVRPDTSWQPPVRPKARVSHGKYLEHSFPPGLWQADTDEIPKEKAWGKRYTVAFPTKKVDMLPSGDYDAYTDGSLMAGRSGAGAFLLRDQSHFCSLRGNTKQATVFQSEMLAIKAAADMLLNNKIEGKRVVFHVDNQAALKTLNSTDITKRSCKETRDSLNKLGQLNEVCLEWIKAHDGIIGNEAADRLAKAGGCSTSVIGQGLVAKSAIKRES